MRKPYPQWQKICKILPLLAQHSGPNPYLYWHKSTKRVPSVAQLFFKSGLLVQMLVSSIENSASLLEFLTYHVIDTLNVVVLTDSISEN